MLELMKKMTLGAAAGVALVTALPIAGPVGTITATGVAVSSALGAAGVAVEHWKK